jgi:phosphoribosylaminoimidazole-succinocarboxamide synthase
VSFDAIAAAIGGELAERVRAATLQVYRFAAEYAARAASSSPTPSSSSGLDADGDAVRDGRDAHARLLALLAADGYRVGTSPPSYDKQYVRDYLETLDWDKTAPGPRVPADVIAATRAKYAEALSRLAGITVD